MTQYSVEPRDRIFVKGFCKRFLSFTKNIVKKLVKI